MLRIKDAETAAGEKVAAAEAEAQSLLSDARREAERIVADGKVQSDEQYDNQVEQIRAAAKDEAKKTMASGKRQATNLRKRFEEGVDGVTDRVLNLFEESL